MLKFSLFHLLVSLFRILTYSSYKHFLFKRITPHLSNAVKTQKTKRAIPQGNYSGKNRLSGQPANR